MIVMDSNILVSALLSRNGASFWLLSHALQGRLKFAVSVALALEYEDVLRRPEILGLSWAGKGDLDHILDAVFAVAKLVQPIHYKRRPALRDPGDDLILECALEASATAIVTMNQKDFSDVTNTYGIEILSPGEMVKRSRKEIS